ncbi:MAG: stage II sporulation protein M [Candidatus Aureabacteria bacterium]|nr:stage II sporulation protein M [Candidatus Auribacterota bacterium]
MNIETFIQNRKSYWNELEDILKIIEDKGLKPLSHVYVRRFISLYRSVSSDLNKAQTYTANAQLITYLHSLIARSYIHIYKEENPPIAKSIKIFFASDYPASLRKHWKPMMISLVIFLCGILFGALSFLNDSDAKNILISKEHLIETPSDRVERIEQNNGMEPAAKLQSATFSSFLFTHNIKVSLLAFTAGITLGIGTAILLFYNGIMLGAIALYYYIHSEMLFFFAWILPHGVIELTAIVIAGGSGFLLAKPILFPMDIPRKEQYRILIKDLVKIILGTSALLVFAGIVEGTISQIHAPRLPYWGKITFSILEGILLYYYLIFYNRKAGKALSA